MLRYFIVSLFLPLTLSAQKEPLNIYDVETGHAVIVYAKNDGLSPFTVILDIKYQGLKPEEPLPKYVVVPGSAQKTVLAKFIISPDSGWDISYSFHYMEGDADAVHDDDYVYQIPFEKGKSFLMSQGYNSRATHRGINALDFTMPQGETIVAARDGIIVKTKEDSNQGCPSSECTAYGNYVRILHSDGTIAEYHHLEKNGALVNEGDMVAKGQVIGKSGATGFATGPHLHFIVFKTDGNKQISFKTKFEYTPGKVDFLVRRTKYTAFK